jgi:hypothetical protein
MTRTSWLYALSCAAVLGAALSIAGCGSSPTASGKDGGAGHGGSGGGSAGATAGATGSAGATGTAGATAGTGGGTAGTGCGTAGTGGGTAGTGTAGATDGGPDVAADTKTDTATDLKTDTSTDGPPTPCVSGGTCTDQDFACTITRTCRRNEEQVCFCAPNNKIACEPCDTIDAGTDANMSTDAGSDAGTDSGTDAGTALAMCPANVMNRNTTCTTNAVRCTTGTCNATTHTEPSCICVVNGNSAGRWFCGFSTRCQ